MLTAQEQAELDALEAEFNPQRQPAAPTRSPGDLNTPNIQVLTPEEEAELVALEQEFSPRQFQAPGTVEEKGIITQLGDAYDSYAAAPIRKAIGTFQDTNSLAQSASALVDQFGEDPSLAPTGKEIAAKAGFSTENAQIKLSPREIEERERPFNGRKKVAPTNEVFSPAGMAGFAVDVAADWTNLVPFVPFAKIAKGAGGVALKGSAKAAKAADAFTGVPLVKVGEVLESGAKATKETLVKTKNALGKAFKPGVADDYNEITRIAAENDIPQELLNDAHKYGENSVMSRYERNVAEGPLGGLEKHEQLTTAVSEATENKIRKIAKTESIPDDIEAGTILKNEWDAGVDRFFDSMGETYGNALKMGKEAGLDMRLDKKSATLLNAQLNDMEKWAMKRLGETGEYEKVINGARSTKGQVSKATGQMLTVLDSTNAAFTKTHKSQAREVLEAIRIAKGNLAKSGGDLNQVYTMLRDVGEVAFKSKNNMAELPSDVRKFQEMYFSGQKALTESLRVHMGDDFAKALIENNSQMSNFFTKRGVVADVIGNKNLGEAQVFNSLVVNGDSKKLDALQSVLSPEAWDKMRATYLHRIINPSADGVINFKQARKDLHKLKVKGKLKLLMDETEMVQMDEVLRVGERGGLGVLSTSGSGGSFKFSNIPGYVKDHIAGETLIDQIKNGTKANYVELPAKTADGKNYTELIKKAPEQRPKSGLSLLREKNPVTARQASKGAQVNSSIERNERLEKYKQIRGIK